MQIIGFAWIALGTCPLLMSCKRLQHLFKIRLACSSAAVSSISSNLTLVLNESIQRVPMARAPTRNLRALPQGGVELQQWKPSPRDCLQMATELLLLLMCFVDIPCGAFEVIELLAIYTLCQRLVLPQARSRNQHPILYPSLFLCSLTLTSYVSTSSLTVRSRAEQRAN